MGQREARNEKRESKIFACFGIWYLYTTHGQPLTDDTNHKAALFCVFLFLFR